MNLLCFDVSSSGIAAALFDSMLEPIRLTEVRWTPTPTLSLETLVAQFKRLTTELAVPSADDSITAISIGSFLHNFVLLDAAGLPLTSVFTWLDSRGEDGVEYVRDRLGETFHQRTGCRYHAMFPVFKLAALHLNGSSVFSKAARVVSLKSVLIHALTGSWVEDHGMASASGLYNIVEGQWDSELLELSGLNEQQLPPVRSRTDVAGRVTLRAAREYRLPEHAAVVNGSGDGFLANIGSECETPARMAVTLGTSGVARQTIGAPVLNLSSGTFCYKAADGAYLLGCAGSNGGNVLDWGRSIFGSLDGAESIVDVPIFIPLLHGERSPDWNPKLTASWHGLKATHTVADLSRSILEGVVFNLAHFVEIVQVTSGTRASEVVLSGNGFLDPMTAPILAGIVDAAVWMPAQPGLASLRGSGVCALRALSGEAPALKTSRVAPLEHPKISDRYRRYRELRAGIT